MRLENTYCGPNRSQECTNLIVFMYACFTWLSTHRKMALARGEKVSSIYTRDGYIIPAHGAVNPRHRLRPDQRLDFMFGQEPPESTKEFEHVRGSISFLKDFIKPLEKYQERVIEWQRLQREMADVDTQASKLKGKLAELGYMTQLEVSDEEDIEAVDIDEPDGEEDQQSKRRRDKARHEADLRQYGKHSEDDRRVRQRTSDIRHVKDDDRQHRQPHKRHRS